MLEIHLDIVAPDVRSHCDNRGAVKLPNDVTGGHSIKVWHDNIHQNHVVLHTFLHLIHSFQTIELEQN